ncbi:MAG TPA: hypothetical protein VHK90_11545 [Thermoanaerobaculia bacterium]|nr:hypothetical protein [Thermoanaerobaculia bacterium]
MKPLLVLFLLAALPLSAAQPYHLELEANPAAAFPYLSRFGKVELHVYAGGVRAEALGLDGISKNGADAVTVANPIVRTYGNVRLSEIAAMLRKLAGRDGSVERAAIPTLGPAMRGKVRGIDATRHRLVFGPQAWIDLWTTSVVPENPQFRRISDQLLEGISPGTAAVARKIRGTPVYVELNFRRFKKVPLLTMKKLTMSADDEREALELGPFYVLTPSQWF